MASLKLQVYEKKNKKPIAIFHLPHDHLPHVPKLQSILQHNRQKTPKYFALHVGPHFKPHIFHVFLQLLRFAPYSVWTLRHSDFESTFPRDAQLLFADFVQEDWAALAVWAIYFRVPGLRQLLLARWSRAFLQVASPAPRVVPPRKKSK